MIQTLRHYSILLTLLIISKPAAFAQSSAQNSESLQWHGWLIKRRGHFVMPGGATATVVTSRRPQIPSGKIDPKVDRRMVTAAAIAESRALNRSIRRCWQYVKTALVRAHAVDSYPQTVYAKEAARELVRKHGFVRLPIRDPYDAPAGAVLVYGGKGAGHVEIRTRRGFVSDYRSPYACSLPFIGAFIKGS